MRVARVTRFGGPEVLAVVPMPDPHAGPGQVRVAVRAAGVSSTDVKARRGEHGGAAPRGSGRDFAGVVNEVGEGARAAVGDRVFGLADEEGAAAELVLATHVAPLPATLGFADAAALPSSLETATRALRLLAPEPGSTLIVNGASGGIGAAAVQLAVARGVRVVGVAGPASLAFVAAIGGEPVVYGPGLADRLRAAAPTGAARALDVAGSGVLPLLVTLTGGPQHVVSVADPAGAAATGAHFTTGEDGRALDALASIGALIDSGRFWLPVERTFRLDRVADAHRLVESGARGRVVLLP